MRLRYIQYLYVDVLPRKQYIAIDLDSRFRSSYLTTRGLQSSGKLGQDSEGFGWLFWLVGGLSGFLTSYISGEIVRGVWVLLFNDTI